MKDAAHAALAILQGILRDMFHTTWAHDIRETVIERFDYDVFDGVRFDITVELAKLKTMLANKQLDQDAYDTQCTRLTLLYAGMFLFLSQRYSFQCDGRNSREHRKCKARLT